MKKNELQVKQIEIELQKWFDKNGFDVTVKFLGTPRNDKAIGQKKMEKILLRLNEFLISET
jgi:hypothetical protein